VTAQAQSCAVTHFLLNVVNSLLWGNIMSSITSTEANRSFSKLLSNARKGQATEITVRGQVVAKIVPIEKRQKALNAKEQKEWQGFLERLRSQPALNLPRINRNELYD
jgi:prevent-host-death family protein